MNMLKNRGWAAVGLGLLVLFGGWCCPSAAGAPDQTFAVLQIGTQMYRNVTVTSKTKDYVFILHSTGMTNLKLKDLSPEERQELGYTVPPPPKTAGATANDWAKHSLAKIETPQVKVLEGEIQQAWSSRSVRGMRIPEFTPMEMRTGIGCLAGLYLFFCYCCSQICVKTGKKPTALVWVPVLQAFPMLDAAGMPAAWFLALLVPGLNVVAAIVWCVKIAKARGKGAGLTILLLLPVLNVFAFMYLAFAGRATRAPKDKRRIEIMTLEAA